jgi:hypothetical protein
VHSVDWISVATIAGILLLYVGPWLLFMKLISYLSREIAETTTLLLVSGVLWVVIVLLLTGMNFGMTVLSIVVQVGIALPYIVLRRRRQ